MPKRLVKFILMGAFLAFVMLRYTMPAAAASDPGSYSFDISEGNITVSAGSYSGYLKVAYGSSGTITNDFVSPQGITITGSTTTNVVVIAPNISDQVNITLNDASIDVSGNSACAFSIGSGSTVNLTLVNSALTANVLHSADSYAGLGVPSGANLNITAGSTGELSAEGGCNGAGIGGDYQGSSGTITINGGTITATAPDSGASIGGGSQGSGTVIINGGAITANCVNDGLQGGGAGIGGGIDGSGTVTINGGTVTANSYSDVLLEAALAGAPDGVSVINGAGIGGGYQGNGIVTINGGTVTASGYNGAGIGGGDYGSGTVIITGGTITATCVNEVLGEGGGAGIGGGSYGSGTVTITGGTITAIGCQDGAGIGGGSGYSGTVTISGGTVTANSIFGAGIGGGNGCVSGTVTVSGGTVTAATSSQYAEGIGKGSSFGSSEYTVIISGGSVNTNTATVYYDNAATVRAYPVTVTLDGVSTVTDISYAVDGGTGAKCSTDSAGKIYLWLPVTGSATMMAADTPENWFWQGSGTIAAAGTNSFTAITSTSAVIILLAQPVDATIMPGQTATLAVTAAGSGTINYQWYCNTADSGDRIISGATSSSYTVTEQVLGYYYCVVTSECNSQTYTVTSDTATVSSLLANISAQPSDIYVAKDGNATLSLTAAAGLGTLSYQWYSNTIGSNKGGDKIDGATASTYSAPTDTVGSVYYYCEVVATYEGYAGLIVSETACVTVGLAITTASLPIGIIGTAYSKTLTAVNGTTYAWNASGLPAGLSMDSSTGVISGTPTDTGIFTVSVTVTNEKSETASAQFSLTINETFSIDLASLSVSPGSLSPNFDKNIVVYSVDTGTSSVKSIGITATTPQDSAATLTINGENAQSSEVQTVYLNQGSNLIPVVVTSPDGSSQKSYVVSVNGTVSNADLSSLTISGYTLNESFAAGTANYTLNVGNETTSLTIAAATSDPKALMIHEGSILPNNTGKTIELAEGQNTLSIMVVAQDASTKTYSITVTREAALSITTASLPIGIIGTAYSKTLSAQGGTSYTWSATGFPAGLSMNPSTGVINGTPTDTGIFTVSITITNEKSETASTQFSLTIYETFSIDLASLSVSPGSVSPNFDKNIVVYSVDTGTSAVQSIDIIAATQHSAATLTIDSENAQSSVAQTVYLNQGSNLIPVVVTSPDGSSQKSYVVSVNGTVSNADLSGLFISGSTLDEYTLNEPFAAGTANYTMNIGNDTTSLTIAAATSDAKALMILDGSIFNTGKTVELAEGQNTLSIMVVAQDASTKTYTITITREATLNITTASLPIGIIDTAYSKTLSAQGGTAPYTWEAGGLPAGLSIVPSTGVISGTPATAGTYDVWLTVSDAHSLSITQNLALKINQGCGAGAYLITPGTDSAYTAGLTDDGIPIMTVKEGHSGFTYFSVVVEPVTGHSGYEVAIFVHNRSDQQIGIMGYKGDFDNGASFQACFNVQAGDEIMIYIVDNLTNDEVNPVIL